MLGARGAAARFSLRSTGNHHSAGAVSTQHDILQLFEGEHRQYIPDVIGEPDAGAEMRALAQTRESWREDVMPAISEQSGDVKYSGALLACLSDLSYPNGARFPRSFSADADGALAGSGRTLAP